VTLARNLPSAAEVDAAMAQAAAAGARIGRAAEATSRGGYSGIFVDPDGHPWEVAHNPGWTLGEDGSVTLQLCGTGGDDHRTRRRNGGARQPVLTWAKEKGPGRRSLIRGSGARHPDPLSPSDDRSHERLGEVAGHPVEGALRR
jgi:hypothetical protein